jgi:hypothetical protein
MAIRSSTRRGKREAPEVVDEEAGVDLHESLRVAQTENTLTSLTIGKQDQAMVALSYHYFHLARWYGKDSWIFVTKAASS